MQVKKEWFTKQELKVTVDLRHFVQQKNKLLWLSVCFVS